MLNLDFTPEQEMLRDMARGLFAQLASHEVVRAMEDDPVGYPVAAVGAARRAGAAGAPAPGAVRRLGLVDARGRDPLRGARSIPCAHPSLRQLCARRRRARARWQSDAQKDEWLPKLASGEDIFTVAWNEPDNGFGPRGVELRAEPAGDGFTLSGTKFHVAFATSARRIVVLARTGDAEDASTCSSSTPPQPVSR